jgi:putative phosphoesterase
MTKLIGLISDTHGLIRPEAVEALQGSDIIIHAGDVGRPDVLGHLMAIAPVFAVRGNVDGGAWAASLPEVENLTFGGHAIHILHILADLAIDPVAAQLSAVIFGHSHEPLIEDKGGVLYINPGSAGPRRFRLPVTVGRLTVEDGARLKPEIIELAV